MTARVGAIRHYPVKGMNGTELDRAALSAGRGLPNDRRFAIAHGAARFESDGPGWLPKNNFLTLMRNERLALLDVRFDDHAGRLTIRRDGRPVLRAAPGEPAGRLLVDQFFAAFMGAEARGAPRLIEARETMLTDVPAPYLSLLNLASLRDLERVARARVDPRRFRANLHLDDLPAWCELGWIGRDVRIGSALLRIVEPIERCAATNVDPVSARRDMNIPLLLQRGFGHTTLGVYAEVLEGGEIAAGDSLIPPAAG